MRTSASTQPRPGVLITVLALAGIVVSLTATIVVPILGQLPQIFHTDASTTAWAVTATLLAGAVATPLTGRLGDLYGKRKIMLVALIPLIAGSVIAALSGSIEWMIVGRALQGLATGIVPLGISVLRDLLPADRVGSGIALMSSSMGIGGAIGLPVAAAVAQYTDWRILFWAVAVISALCGAAILWIIPATKPLAKGKFDPVGTVGLSVVLVALLLAISKGASWGWGSATTITMFVVAVVVALAWGWWELRTPAPLVDLRVTARPQVLLTNLASIVVGFAMFAQSLIIPQLMQLPVETGYGLGQTMLQMGFWMAPAGIAMMLVSPVGAKISAARGPKTTLIVGGIVMAIGYGSSALFMGSLWGLLVTSVVASAGVAFAYGAMPSLIMGAVPRSETGSANGVNSLMRSIGSSISSAVVGAVLAAMSVDLGGYTIATEDGFRTGLLIGCGVAVAAALIAVTIPAKFTPGMAVGHGHHAPAPAEDEELVAAAS
ncbi:MFS transporter [Agromyces protaetiae]|uniref:MFS transporter n=1 Tax=Agromyces protaetiae TaxID=2509455 RepID=A0A4P6FA65_9MICO|nr:MFS transporter [Agromyces protaetiae]QAY72476.1 MFS transporter [Agromyces protaetiae]